jgi:queuine tRNA-ribosyltransferase
MATRCSSFEVLGRTGAARAGVLTLPHGRVPTPAFMPVGTRGTVRGLSPEDVANSGASMLLANAYHLWVRPGEDVVAHLGGLHRFMGWTRPILTDSGGFQVFSLKEFATVSEEGVRFRAPEDGAYRFLSPEVCVAVQEALGVDVAMALDECIEWPASRERVVASTARTTRWLERAIGSRKQADRTALFGIVQGGTYAELRAAHAVEIAGLELDGFAIGGLSVGEDGESRNAMIEASIPGLPEDRPRYLMGVGQPIDIADAVVRGVDMFDCVLPTRAGRHAQAYTWEGRRNLRNASYARDDTPLDANCPCRACAGFSRGYLRHLVKAEEILAGRLLTEHNLTFYQQLVARLRAAILTGETATLERVRQDALRASGQASGGDSR